MLNYQSHDEPEELDSIHNYYEQRVIGHLARIKQLHQFDDSLLADIACVALNLLPPRYIRYDVDMAFYQSAREYQETEDKIRRAIEQAITFIKRRGRRE